MKKRLLFLMVILALSALACSLPILTQTTAAEPVVTPAIFPTASPIPSQAAAEPSVAMTMTVYPPDPEGVVSAFLAAYQGQRQDMPSYLSSGRMANLPEGGAVALLGVTGQLDGFAIQSAAVSPDPPTAIVEVGMVVDGGQILRQFYLVFDYSRWAIDDIASPSS